MKILFLTTILLSKNCNGGEVASQCFIDALRALGHDVTVVGYLRHGDRFEHNPNNTLIVDRRHVETRKSKWAAAAWMILGFLKNLPYSSAKYYSKTYVRLLKRLLREQKYDVVVIDHAQMSWIKKWIGSACPMMTIAHNVEHDIYHDNVKQASNALSRWIYRREARLIDEQERSLAIAAHHVLTLTEHDADYFSKIVGPNNVSVSEIPPDSKQPLDTPIKAFDVGLLGSWSWKANDEAMQWFLAHVYPHLPASLSIHVAGKGADWLSEKYPNIVYRGVVPDAQAFMAEARVVAIPSLGGSGIQIKTLDAIASGSQIVATPVAMRGIENPPSTVCIAESAKDFAERLATAALSTHAEQSFEEAKTWHTMRKQRFMSALTHALENLERPLTLPDGKLPRWG